MFYTKETGRMITHGVIKLIPPTNFFHIHEIVGVREMIRERGLNLDRLVIS